MEARDNSFDLDTIHKSKPKPLLRQHSQSQPQPQSQSQSQPHHFTHSYPARQRSGQWLSSPSFSQSQTSFSHQRPREHFPLRHQPLSYPQERPHSQSHHLHSYTSSCTYPANSDSKSLAPVRSQHYPRDAFQSTSFSNPVCNSDAYRDRIRPKNSAISSGSTSNTADFDWSSSSFSNIDAVTHAIRNKIIVEEDEEDILSTDRFY
ncbi:uncharacterized protein LOC115758559 [Drosophila novamexicana]|uniref:uncharacterized protein LOC115758559 n=1 Tax=Drosophila novamexicana TaxID=47314 RepID=UPI0011E607C6|nr:uncharacterized protein LOC115758559 [Drosophila novamexicana]